MKQSDDITRYLIAVDNEGITKSWPSIYKFNYRTYCVFCGEPTIDVERSYSGSYEEYTERFCTCNGAKLYYEHNELDYKLQGLKQKTQSKFALMEVQANLKKLKQEEKKLLEENKKNYIKICSIECFKSKE